MFILICLKMSNDNNKSVSIFSKPKRGIISHKSFTSPFNKKQNHETKKCRREFVHAEPEKYTIPGEVPLPIRKLKKAEIILPFKYYYKLQDTARFNRRLSIKINEKYKIISSDLQRRLHVDNPLNDIYSATDIDIDYYKFLKGRPLQFNIQNFANLKESINKILRLKQDTGINRDCIFNIEINSRNELDIYALSVKRLTDQAKHFDEFISEDYKKSMDFLTKWDNVKCKVDLKTKELQNVAMEKFTLKSRLIGLEYNFSVQLKYGRFLYYLSPPIWRLNNREFARSVEIEAKGFDYGKSNDEDTFAVIFEKLKKICFEVPIRPVLYFTHPRDLMDEFNVMENQQVHYYTHVNHLNPLARILKEKIKLLKIVIFQENAIVNNVIKSYENLLNFTEDRCNQLERKFYKILYGLFFNSVGEPEVLKLIVHLEFCYEKIFLEKPINIDITVIAKSIEIFYMDYLKQLDKIHSGTVRGAVLKCIEKDRLKAKKAKLATNELRLFHRLERALLRAYGVYADKKYMPIKINSDMNKSKQQNSSNNSKIKPKEFNTLSDVEMEYLVLFTDWTENEDPAN